MGQLLQVFSIISGAYQCFYSYDNRIRPSPVVTDSSQNGTVYDNIDWSKLYWLSTSESNQVNAPTKVNVNTYLRSIDKIDDYKMVNRLTKWL